jgi:hypothetical protein
MVLSRVDLLLHPTYSRSIVPHEHKQVLGVEPDRGVLVDDFNVCQVLTVGAHLVLTLDNEDSAIAKHATSFCGSLNVER